MSTHPHPDESLRLCTGLCQSITVTLAAAKRVSHRQPKGVWLTAVTVVSFHIYLNLQTQTNKHRRAKLL